MYSCYWFETEGVKQYGEKIGYSNMLFETDFPHPTSLYPGAQEKLVESVGGYDYETRKQILERNASGVFNLGF